jgi:hypothetical protein
VVFLSDKIGADRSGYGTIGRSENLWHHGKFLPTTILYHLMYVFLVRRIIILLIKLIQNALKYNIIQFPALYCMELKDTKPFLAQGLRSLKQHKSVIPFLNALRKYIFILITGILYLYLSLYFSSSFSPILSNYII